MAPLVAGPLAAVALAACGLLLPAAAVDRSQLRICDQGSFCGRFKAWIERPEREKALWSAPAQMKAVLPGGGFGYRLQHLNEADPHMLLRVNMYASGMVRVRLSEIDPIHPRHEIPAGDVVQEPGPKEAVVKVADGPGSTILTLASESGADNQAELKHAPLALDVTVGGHLVQRVNARNFLNFERYRKSGDDAPPDSGSATGAVNDVAAHPHELDRSGVWEEEFGGHTDKKPRGPASLGMGVTFEGGVPGLFGLTGHMTKASLPFYREPHRIFNLDVFEHENDEPMALHGAIPFIWAIHNFPGASPVVSGFLWINPSETFVKIERDDFETDGPAHAWWTSENGVMDVVVLAGPAPKQVSGQFHALRGTAPMPGLWALGKHQCRWNHMSAKDVATVDSSYDKYDLPYDVLWLDIEHTNGKAYATWNETNFPTPEKMTASLSAKKRKLVGVVNPHVKKEDSFNVYAEVRDKGLFVKKVDGKKMDDPRDTTPEDWVTVEKIPDPDATQPQRRSPDGERAFTASQDKSCIVWNLEFGTVSKQLMEADEFAKAMPAISMLLLMAQVGSSAFTDWVPWSPGPASPFQFIRIISMLKLESLDFFGSHTVFVSGKAAVYLFLAVDLIYGAFTGKLMILSKVLKDETSRKLRSFLVYGCTQFLFIPMVTEFMQLLTCDYLIFEQLTPYMQCNGWTHSVLRAVMVPLILAFTLTQLPYIVVGGEAALVRPKDILKPRKWAELAQEKQDRIDPGLFKVSAPNREESLLSPIFVAALAELIVKITVAVTTAGTLPPVAGMFACLAAIVLTMAVQVAMPRYSHRVANEMLVTCKAMMLACYVMGFGLVCTVGRDTPDKDRPVWPTLALYVVLAAIVANAVRRFYAMAAEGGEEDDEGVRGAGLQAPLLQQ